MAGVRGQDGLTEDPVASSTRPPQDAVLIEDTRDGPRCISGVVINGVGFEKLGRGYKPRVARCTIVRRLGGKTASPCSRRALLCECARSLGRQAIAVGEVVPAIGTASACEITDCPLPTPASTKKKKKKKKTQKPPSLGEVGMKRTGSTWTAASCR